MLLLSTFKKSVGTLYFSLRRAVSLVKHHMCSTRDVLIVLISQYDITVVAYIRGKQRGWIKKINPDL